MAPNLRGMQANVLAELEYVEQRAVGAAATGEQHRERALTAVASHAAAALSTLLHIGLITPEEDAAWRARLGRALGDENRLARTGYTITVGGPRTPTAEDQARSAYLACRDLALTHLAWVHHTAANEAAIAEAVAGDAHDPMRVRRACELGFADRGKTHLALPDL